MNVIYEDLARRARNLGFYSLGEALEYIENQRIDPAESDLQFAREQYLKAAEACYTRVANSLHKLHDSPGPDDRVHTGILRDLQLARELKELAK